MPLSQPSNAPNWPLPARTWSEICSARFHNTLERVDLPSSAIHPLPGTTSLEIMVGLKHLPALRELSVCLDAVGIAQSLQRINELRGLKVLALQVDENSLREIRIERGDDDDDDDEEEDDKQWVGALQAFFCCSPPLETLKVELESYADFDLTAMEFGPSLQHLILTGLYFPALPPRTGAETSAVRNRSLRTLSLNDCALEGDDFAFVYHLQGLEKLELNDTKWEGLPAHAWGILPGRMPALGALQIRPPEDPLEALIDETIFSVIADGIPESSAFESLEVSGGEINVTTVGPLLQRLRGTCCLFGVQWSVNNITFISDALASGSDLQHVRLAFFGGTGALSYDEWYEPLFRALRCCRRLESVELHHEDFTTDDYSNTRLQLGNEFREWLGSSTTLQSLAMHGYSFNQCFLANAGTGVLRSSSLISVNFRDAKFEDLSVFGQALVEGATLQKFYLNGEALSDDFLLQLARMPHLKTLTVNGNLDNHVGRLVEAVRSNTALEQISTVQESDFEVDPDEVEQSRATMDHYLALNRYGRRFLITQQLLPGLWATVLAKASTHAEHAVLFHFLRAMPSLVRSTRRGVSRNRPESPTNVSLP